MFLKVHEQDSVHQRRENPDTFEVFVFSKLKKYLFEWSTLVIKHFKSVSVDVFVKDVRSKNKRWFEVH